MVYPFFGLRLFDKLLTLGKVTLDSVEGCRNDEIEEIKRKQGVLRLPEIYIEFLSIFGRQAGYWYEGVDCFYPGLVNLKQSARDTLTFDKNPFQLPDDAFVFLDYDGYQFMYFHTSGTDDDPPVYLYEETGSFSQSDNIPQKSWEHLSHFLTSFIEEAEGVDMQKKFLSEWNITL